MAPEPHELLAQSDSIYIVAAAGCGKTQVIARAIAVGSDGRQLVLTHTHAGVNSLKRRLRTLKVPESRYHVDTIAGWALRYATAFPALSGIKQLTPVGTTWHETYIAAIEVLQSPAIRKIVRASYAGIYVDEYQDCTFTQHRLILALADVLPCRVLGDPLQGIFEFRKNDRLVDWDQDVPAAFTRLPDLITPWRWHGGNEALGDWLLNVRADLLEGRDIDMQKGPSGSMQWRSCTPDNQRSACLNLAHSSRGTVVALMRWPNGCHSFASKLSGIFTSMEEVECKDLLKWCKTIEEKVGLARAAAVIDFAKTCMTQVGTELGSLLSQFNRGRLPQASRYKKHPDVVDALLKIASDDRLDTISHAMHLIGGMPEVVIYRRELWNEMGRAIKVYSDGKCTTLWDAAWDVRNRVRQQGRSLDHRTVSRTLLVKGLEFDHVVVLNAEEFDRKNLYVAMTRATRSLTVLSSSPVITPA